MVVVFGITIAGYYKVQPLPLQTLPFAQPDITHPSGRGIDLGRAPGFPGYAFVNWASSNHINTYKQNKPKCEVPSAEPQGPDGDDAMDDDYGMPVIIKAPPHKQSYFLQFGVLGCWGLGCRV